MDPRIEEVLKFWFDPVQSPRWFAKSDAFDKSIRDRFGDVHAAALRGDCEAWLETPRGRLAYIILLDQFSRNIHRDTPAMFSGDERALKAARAGIAKGDDKALAPAERSFFYMPYMHSEDLADQEMAVALFKGLPGNGAEYAVMHRDIVKRFGRFPHRNRILGRPSTPEEIAFLKTPGSSF
jgi:uncharacterized protein (DUF924 family)